ncbi:hypothetical protein AB1Y20_000593 [Prymnesium parvum]|uniref:Glycosyltransferase family 92 protein n=1 Tax=Prymnesium parvum TaxID=97485 RepID=A0AB34K8Z4_PRYPA
MSHNAAGTPPAIVCTARGVASSIHAWCDYHLAIGFERLYLYFDDPTEHATLNLEARYGAHRISAVAADASLRHEWESLPGAHEWLPYVATEVQARQTLNALHAVRLHSAWQAQRAPGWLLHIDADELFHAGSATDAGACFEALSLEGVQAMQFANHEAVPESEESRADQHEGASDFSRVTLFKRNPDLLPPSGAARQGVEWWFAHRGGFFQYYTNGKGAVRCTPSARPLSVHEWLPGSVSGLEHCASNMPSQHSRTRGMTKYRECDAAILHYGVCSADMLLQRWLDGEARYLLRGRTISPRIFEEGQCLLPDKSSEKQEDAILESVHTIFASRFVLANPAEIEFQLAVGACVRISTVKEVLECAKKTHAS